MRQLKPGKSSSLSLSLYNRLTRQKRLVAQEQPLLTAPRPEGPVVWLHATTETQAIALLEMAQRLAVDREELWFLVTVTSGHVKSRLDAHLMAGPMAQTVVMLFAGDDVRIAQHWRPDVCVWTGGTSHPALLEQIAETAKVMILADAESRRPANSGPLQLPGLRKAVLTFFDLILAVDKGNATRLRSLVPEPAKVEHVGRLREGTSPPGCNDAERDALAAKLAARPVWLAANCISEEYPVVIKAHANTLRASHRLLLIIIPFDKSHGETIRKQAEAEGLAVGLRSEGDEPEAEMQVYIADFAGESGLWYRISPICFVGQTLAPGKAPHPWDPAALGSAILFGPAVQTAQSAFDLLENHGAALQVENGSELADAVVSLLAPDKAAQMAHNAWVTITEGSEVLDRLTNTVGAALDGEPVSFTEGKNDADS